MDLLTRRIVIYSAITVVVVALFLIVVRPLLEAKLTIIDYAVPTGYSGWLVVSWNCAGGTAFGDLPKDGNRHLITFAADGTACVADNSPSPGYGIGHFTYVDGGAAPARPGGSLDAARYYAATPTGGTPAASTTGHTYSLASIGIGGPASLGDRCDLDQFLQQHFGEPRSGWPCGPVPDQIDVVKPS